MEAARHMLQPLREFLLEGQAHARSEVSDAWQVLARRTRAQFHQAERLQLVALQPALVNQHFFLPEWRRDSETR